MPLLRLQHVDHFPGKISFDTKNTFLFRMERFTLQKYLFANFKDQTCIPQHLTV